MKANAVILHGTGCSPQQFWFPWLKRVLELRGFEVWCPQLPEASVPNLKTQLPFVLNGWNYNSQSVLIGHSAGVPLALALAEALALRSSEPSLAQLVLVAGYLDLGREVDPIVKPIFSYDWKAMQATTCGKNYVINSENDPWGCDHTQGATIAECLNATQIICYGQGHFGSETFQQPYREFELLESLVG